MTKEVRIGNLTIGGNQKVAVQSMTNTVTCDVDKTVEQIIGLQKIGCDIIRVAVLNESDANAIKQIKQKISIPLVADIHFDYRLALIAIESGADKIRINPGNISNDAHLVEIIEAAKKHGTCIRIGVNGGSLNKEIESKFGNTSQGLVESILQYIDFFENHGFFNLVLSVKSSSVTKTIEACRLLATRSNYPQHIGVTESGAGELAKVKSAIGIGSLLADGIGSTIRVSLTDDPKTEVNFAYQILKAIGLKKNFCEIISCPTCGRCQFDMIAIVENLNQYVANINKPLKIAVMGCVVNGPGEAKEADLGLAGGNGRVVFFKHGKIYKTVDKGNILEEFKREIDSLVE